MNQPNERYCSTCSLDLKSRPLKTDGGASISTRKVIVFLLIVAAAFLLFWFILAEGASGLSDS